MRVLLAYIGVVLLWATTPLAIKWSGEGPGFLFGVTGRMSIGGVCMLLLLLMLRRPLVWHKQARKTYFAVALQIYGAMVCVYWGAQFIPSGWISVLFGLTPLMTALLAALWLGERSLAWGKIAAYFFGISGLSIMFGSALQLGRSAVLGMTAVLLAAFLQSASAVWVKRIGAKIPALSQVAGGLLFAVPVYWISWFWADAHWPVDVSGKALFSIVYLGVVATTAGFAMYYYILTRLSATRVALITLVSPVLALFLGHFINQEPVSSKVVAGTLLILSALLLHEFAERRGKLKSS